MCRSDCFLTRRNFERNLVLNSFFVCFRLCAIFWAIWPQRIYGNIKNKLTLWQIIHHERPACLLSASRRVKNSTPWVRFAYWDATRAIPNQTKPCRSLDLYSSSKSASTRRLSSILAHRSFTRGNLAVRYFFNISYIFKKVLSIHSGALGDWKS